MQTKLLTHIWTQFWTQIQTKIGIQVQTEIKKWMAGVETVRWQADGDCQTVSVLNYKPVSCTMYNVQLYLYLYMASVANVLEGYFLGGGNFSALVWIQSLL